MEDKMQESASPPSPRSQDERDGNTMIAAGVGIGVIGAVGAVIGGAICPICVIAAPLLVGVGAFRRARAPRR